jgi:hypothetical protein
MKDKEISIWFFIGLSLLGNGIFITGAGLYELLHPPAQPTVVLFRLHANFWWGLVLLILGLIYCWRFFPSTQKEEEVKPEEPVMSHSLQR